MIVESVVEVEAEGSVHGAVLRFQRHAEHGTDDGGVVPVDFQVRGDGEAGGDV